MRLQCLIRRLLTSAVHQSKPYLPEPFHHHGVVCRAEPTHSTPGVNNKQCQELVSPLELLFNPGVPRHTIVWDKGSTGYQYVLYTANCKAGYASCPPGGLASVTIGPFYVVFRWFDPLSSVNMMLADCCVYGACILRWFGRCATIILATRSSMPRHRHLFYPPCHNSPKPPLQQSEPRRHSAQQPTPRKSVKSLRLLNGCLQVIQI